MPQTSGDLSGRADAAAGPGPAAGSATGPAAGSATGPAAVNATGPAAVRATSPRPYPWPSGSATGVGSLPGTDPLEAMRLVFGELPDLPHLAELPHRGAGADLAGRTAALLVDLPVETTPAGWRLADRPGRDLRRARAMLAADLDALEEAGEDYRGPLKLQVCGPWTLAGSLELTRSQDPALADAGALADVQASLAEGVAAHVADVRRRLPMADVLLQLDEPGLPSVLTGGVPTASGLNRLPAVPLTDAEAGLRVVVSHVKAFTIVHCCAASVPFGVITGAGADGVGFDLALLGRDSEEALGEAVEAGLGIIAGALPVVTEPRAGQQPVPSGPPGARGAAERVVRLWDRLGWPVSRRDGAAAGTAAVAEQVVLSPACGLAGAAPATAKTLLARCREAARLLPELIEEKRP